MDEAGIILGMEKLKGFSLIVDQATRGELVFPTSVNAALRLQLALADADCHIEDVIKKVLAEPVLAARTVALANSMMFNRSGDAVTSVRAAVARVGYRNLYSMAAAMVVRQFGHRIRDAGLRARAEQLWRHTAHVAALAHVIARKITSVDADTALFAGIVHGAGGHGHRVAARRHADAAALGPARHAADRQAAGDCGLADGLADGAAGTRRQPARQQRAAALCQQ